MVVQWVDTWATVGSCAQIGKNVHLSGGVEYRWCTRAITNSSCYCEDDCFVGSRCIVVEGVHVKKAVLGANVVLTARLLKLSMLPVMNQ